MESTKLLIGLLGSLASIYALFQATRNLWKKNRRKALIDGVVFTVAAVITGTTFYFWQQSPENGPTAQLKQRVEGLLESAHSELVDAVLGLRMRLSDADAGLSSPIAPKLPGVLGTFLTDGEAFLLLSDPMQQELPQFIKDLQTYTAGYEWVASQEDKDVPQPGTISMMLLECATQELCVRIEKMYQAGNLDSDDHKKRFSAALSYKALFFLTGNHHAKTLNGKVVQQNLNLSKEETEANAFWVGYHFDACVNSANSGSTPNQEQLTMLERTQNRLQALGLAVDLKELLAGVQDGSEEYALVLQLIEDGLVAYWGEQTMATLTFGFVLTPTLDTFSWYATDPAYRKQFIDGGRDIMQVGMPINTNINAVSLPEPTKKQWVPLCIGVILSDPATARRAKEWKEEVLRYYRDLSGSDGA